MRFVCCWSALHCCKFVSRDDHPCAGRGSQGLSEPKPSRDALIWISFVCNFSMRLVNLKQQPYKSCSFVWAADQVLHRNILEEEKKKRKREEEELGQLCASDGRYLILRFCKNNILAIAFMRGIYRTILQPTCV